MVDKFPDDSSRLLPVSVLTGFLGSGKTTTLNHVLQHPDFSRTLVLINEFGEIGLDHELVTHCSDDVVIKMASGCLCCTIRGDLSKTLREAPGRFARGGKLWFDRVLIETTGLADPAPILHTLMTERSLTRRYRLDGVITTVDAVNGDATLDRQVESVKQAAVADRLLLTKTDIAARDVLHGLRDRLRTLNPAAPQILAANGAVDPAQLFDAGLFDPRSKSPAVRDWLRAEAFADQQGGRSQNHHHGHHHDHHHEHDHDHDVNRHDAHIKAFCLTLDEPFDRGALHRWLEELSRLRGEDLLRIKGLVNVTGLDGPVVVHAVQHVIHPPVMLPTWPSADRRSQLVFITRDIAEAELRETLPLAQAG
ncbi:MAG: GTP-binding protein [Pseudomonadota bacterium]